METTNVLAVHAQPPMLTVEVRSDRGTRLAFAEDLAQTADRPVMRLTRRGKKTMRQDIWPTSKDIGQLVILPGGEAGRLLQWWNAADGSE